MAASLSTAELLAVVDVPEVDLPRIARRRARAVAVGGIGRYAGAATDEPAGVVVHGAREPREADARRRRLALHMETEAELVGPAGNRHRDDLGAQAAVGHRAILLERHPVPEIPGERRALEREELAVVEAMRLAQ